MSEISVIRQLTGGTCIRKQWGDFSGDLKARIPASIYFHEINRGNIIGVTRIIIASILAPLIAPLLFFCFLLIAAFGSGTLESYGPGSLVLAFLIGAPIAYLNIAVIVTSIWLIAGKHALSKLWLVCCAGTLSGVFTMLIMGGLRMSPMYNAMMVLGGLVGFVSTVVFWAIVHMRNSASDII